MDRLLNYFSGDELAAKVWQDKYQVKDLDGNPKEETPDDMHRRLSREFSRSEANYKQTPDLDAPTWNELSHFGRHLPVVDEAFIYSYLKDFKYIVPQGSIMSILGNPYKIGSLSNCFVIPSPQDSYGGILHTDESMVQLMKRRGGVGTTLDPLRPSSAKVTNSAGTSTGVPSFAERFSNSTREVAQEGRRGALMLLLSCKHPDIFKFTTMKKDRTKVTGANISVMLTDNFMDAAQNDADFLCRFPIDLDMNLYIDDGAFEEWWSLGDYNELKEWGKGIYFMKIKARELFDLIVEMAWENAEPGVAFMDRVHNYSPEGVYEQFRAIASNPCGEQWMQAYDSCRLFAANLFSLITNPFTSEACIDWDKAYEIFYVQQRLGDDLVDLEIEHVQAIIAKIISDPEPMEIKRTELELWEKVLQAAQTGRRTGCGFTALGDMLAALGLKYDSNEGMKMIGEIMHTKMKAELDCTIDLSVLRGSFTGWDRNAEYNTIDNGYTGQNDFYKILWAEFPEQVYRMWFWGRRNVSWSTVAPTGTVSIMTQTTSGLEPIFSPFYFRKTKINPNDGDIRVDFVDQNGDKWQEHVVLHPKFKEWIKIYLIDNNQVIIDLEPDPYITLKETLIRDNLLDEIISNLDRQQIEELYVKSPWYQSTANDIDWERRVQVQAIIQRYTTNAISSTINLPKDVSKETVSNIYFRAWNLGLKGVTVYRDTCRSGVLTTESTKVETDNTGHTKAQDRPKELQADYYAVSSRGRRYAVIIGLLDEAPYEVFAFENPQPQAEEQIRGRVIRVQKGRYKFESDHYTIDNLQLSSDRSDEKVLTRWMSLLLRHGANPLTVIEQTEKSELEVTAFPKVLCRILKKYVTEEGTSEDCPQCNNKTLVRQEGCLSCKTCGYSKC